MMGRFGIPGVTSSASRDAGSSNSSSGSSSAGGMGMSSSISAISSMSSASTQRLKSFTKKVGAGFNTMSALPSFAGVDAEKKARMEAEQRRALLNEVLEILETVHLQCPMSHTGLVLAFTGSTLSPIMNPGIKYTWYRMGRTLTTDHNNSSNSNSSSNSGGSSSSIEQVDESLHAWYAPTVDDIGCVICAQCEDNFGEGFSRYYECGPLKADPMLCSMAESAVENGSFEAQGICVSLGLEQERTVLRGEEIYASQVLSQIAAAAATASGSSSSGRDSLATTAAAADGNSNSSGGSSSHGQHDESIGSQSAAVSAAAAVAYGHDTANALPTVLSKNTAFLQLDGRSTVEVDERGVFISIPTFDNTALPVIPQQSKGKYVNMMFNLNGGSGNSTATAAAGRQQQQQQRRGSKGQSNNKKRQLHTSRRGLRIPASSKLRVLCVQPLSLVLVLPITTHRAETEADTSQQQQQQQQQSRNSTNGDHSSSNSSGGGGDSSNSGGKETAPAVAAGATTKAEAAEDVRPHTAAAAAAEEVPAVAAISTDQTDAVEAEKMRRFLSASIVSSIPWSYEGHHLSPEAYIASAASSSDITAEEREQLLRDTERDSIVFASTVCSLAEFISALPEGTSELRVCFSCPDRYVRDTLALSIRALVCQPEGSTRYERMQVFPWYQSTAATSNGGGDNGEEEETEGTATAGGGVRGGVLNDLIANTGADISDDTKRRLRKREEENSTLKKERNELTRQLLEAREELVNMRHKIATSTVFASNSNHNNSSSGVIVNGVKASTEVVVESDAKGSGCESELAGTATSADDAVLLSSKLIELENSLLVANKKEAENSRVRSDIEARNVKLNADVQRYQKSCEELNSKLASLQSLYDRQSRSIELLEADQVSTNSLLEDNAKKLREMDALREQLRQKEAQIDDQKRKLQSAAEDASNYKQLIDHQNREKEELVQRMKQIESEHLENVAQLEKRLSEGMQAAQCAESALQQLQQQLSQQQSLIAESEKLREKLQQERAENDKLAGELNSLQRKSDSQGRDLKKVMKDNAVSLAEFEKALVRKSEECNDLYNQLQQLQDELRQASSSSGGGNVLSSVFKGMSAAAAASATAIAPTPPQHQP